MKCEEINSFRWALFNRQCKEQFDYLKTALLNCVVQTAGSLRCLFTRYNEKLLSAESAEIKVLMVKWKIKWEKEAPRRETISVIRIQKKKKRPINRMDM